MKYTKTDVMKAVEQFNDERKKTTYEYPIIKYHGEYRKRSFPKVIYTDTYEYLLCNDNSPLNYKMFVCECCGKKVSYNDLESWVCDFDKDSYICSLCYESAMGEDL